MDSRTDAARNNFCPRKRRRSWREGRSLLGRLGLSLVRHAGPDYAPPDQRADPSHLWFRTLLRAILHPRKRSNRPQAFLACVAPASRRLLATQWKAAPPQNFLNLNSTQLHRDLIDDFNPESFKRGYTFGSIRKQTNAPQVQVRKNLRSDSDLALRLALVVEQRRQLASAMEHQPGSLAHFL